MWSAAVLVAVAVLRVRMMIWLLYYCGCGNLRYRNCTLSSLMNYNIIIVIVIMTIIGIII